jgi:hypothetical protein
MNRITLAATGVAVLAMLAPAAAQTMPPARTSITVTGQADVDHAPDQATVGFSIATNDDNAAHATSANNGIYNALVAKLGGLGIAPAAIKTTSYNVSFNPRPPNPNPQFAQRYGYVVSRYVTVTTPRTDQVGALIDAGIGAGVTNVGSVNFGLRDNRGVYRQALGAAVADASAQAQALADAAHVRILRILSIGSASYAPVPRPGPVIGRMAMAAAPVPTDVQPSDLTVHAAVTVRYEIAP